MTMAESAAIHRAPTRNAVIRLLESAELPTSDLTDAHLQSFFYIGSAAAPLGIIGVEFHGPNALLRSLVVRPEHRARGLAKRLVDHVESYARERSAIAIYLLTTTAEGFFRSRGYLSASRDSAPRAIRSTPEFSALCPASSAFLVKRL